MDTNDPSNPCSPGQVPTRTRVAPAKPGATPPRGRIATELLEESRRRLSALSVVLAATIAVVVLLDVALTYVAGWAEPGCGTRLVGFTGAGLVLLSLVTFALASTPRVSAEAVLRFGLVYEVAGAFGIALASWFDEPRTHLHPGPWLGIWIVLFPLVVPNALWKNAVAALLAAASAPLVLTAMSLRDGAPPEAREVVEVALPAFVCAGLALVPSQLFRELGARVTRAQAKARELGSYRLTKLLGRGGMGEVWQAEHQLLARPAAIKLVQLEAIAGETPSTRGSTLRRFEREARATASLRSPHTVSVHDYGVTGDGTFYYVMELLEGLDLESLVRHYGPLPPARVVHVLRGVLSSLAEAHAAGMVHRDIKPANLYLTRLGIEHDFVKVLDFGLVTKAEGCQCEDRERLTDANTIVGTPTYMAPEMAAGQPDVDGRADLYALGCVAYWLLTGTHLFDPTDRTPMQLLADHMKTPPEAPSARLGAEVPAALENLILQMLEKDPADRPASALELRELLEHLPIGETWTEDDARRWWEDNHPERARPGIALVETAPV